MKWHFTKARKKPTIRFRPKPKTRIIWKFNVKQSIWEPGWYVVGIDSTGTELPWTERYCPNGVREANNLCKRLNSAAQKHKWDFEYEHFYRNPK